MSREPSLVLLWIEDCPDWAAAGAHLRGTLARLRELDLKPKHVIARTSNGERRSKGVLGKFLRIMPLLFRAAVAARKDRVLIARWHPLLWPVQRFWSLVGGRSLILVQGNVADLHAANPWTARVPMFERFATKSLARADQIVTPATGIADWIAVTTGLERARILVLPNGADLQAYAGEREASVDGLVGPYAVFVGNMATWQGVDLILEALESSMWPKDLGLVFVGDGEHARLVADSLDPRVSYVGRKDRAEMIRILRGASISLAARRPVAASMTGVSPFKIIEAAAAGVPAVVTRIPGQTELAEALGGSILIDPDDPEAIATAVAQLHEDTALAASLSTVARERVRRFSWESGAPVLSQALEAVTS